MAACISNCHIFYIAIRSLPEGDARDTSRRDVQKPVAISQGW